VCVNVPCDQMLGRPKFQVFVCVCARVYVCVYCVFKCFVRTLTSLEFQVWVCVRVCACVCESMCGCNMCVNVLSNVGAFQILVLCSCLRMCLRVSVWVYCVCKCIM